MKEILKFAIKGINTEIDEREKTIAKGKQLIRQIESGERAKTKMTISEIQEVIREKEKEIEELSKKKFEYKWELEVSLK